MENNNLEKVEKEYWGKSFYGSKLNTILLLILIVLMIFALRFMYQNQGEYLSNLNSENLENAEVLKEYKNDELGFSFNYSENLSIEKIDSSDSNTLILKVFDIENHPKTSDYVNICNISVNCFAELPDVYKSFGIPYTEPLQEIGKIKYGENEYIKYKDPTFGEIPLTIYTIRFAPGKILGIQHFGEDEPPRSIDLSSIKLIKN